MKLDTLIGTREQAQFAEDVRDGLTRHPRQLPSRYLYDGLGSALFEAICHLPWYGVTRAEHRLLARDAGKLLTSGCRMLVELGPGNGSKMASLLSNTCPDDRPLTVHLVDVSRAALRQAARTLEQFRGVSVVQHAVNYEAGLEAFGASRGADKAIALLLGSNIGNFAPDDARVFLTHIREALRPGDGFLLGTDLVKPERRLLEAYDDPLGVTAAFNRNLLVRLREHLDADIDLGAFAHRAVWNPEFARIEMHLVSLRSQRIVIPAADLDFTMTEGETIWTESSHKYEPDGVRSTLEQCGFSIAAQWIDQVDRFALTYAVVR